MKHTQKTLLKYSIMTEPFPLQASPKEGKTKIARVTIVASNPDPEEPVTVKKIGITLPIGPNGSDLAAEVPPTPVPPAGWDPLTPTKGAGKVIFSFVPKAGQQTITTQGLEFLCKDLEMNRQAGTCNVEIEETIPNDENVEVLEIGKFPHGWGEVQFTVNPANIEAGETTKLKWNGPEGAVYKIEYAIPGKIVRIPKQGGDKLGPNGTYPGDTDPPLTLSQTTIFTLNVSMESGRYEAEQQRTVTVVWYPASLDYFRPRGCTTSDCVVRSDELVLDWDFKHVDYWQLIQEWPDFPQRPARVIELPWSTRSIAIRPTEKKTRYTLMVKDRISTLTAVVNATLAQPVPVGTIIPYGALYANNLPTGWLYCNGAEFVKAEYPQLYPAIQDVWGPSTALTGRLPDLRGYFVRGYDDRAGVDPGRKLGSKQEDAFQSHTHGQKVTANNNYGSGVRVDYSGEGTKLGEYEQGVQTFEAGTAFETRPKNVSTYFVIYAGVYSPAAPRSTRREEPQALTAKPASKTSKKASTKGGRGRTKGRRSGR